MRVKRSLLFVIVFVFMYVPITQGDVVWHDPWLNWDFINQNPVGPTVVVNDFEVVVDDPNGTFNPNPNDPNEQWAAPFPNFSTSQVDHDGDGDLDRVCSWSGAPVAINAVAHGGLYMKGSGRVLDAYFTVNGNPVYVSTPITYEMTEIRGDPEVHMQLQIAPGFYEDQPSHEAGWQNIRTFVNIPADLLGLEDLNADLDLDALSQYEVDPFIGQPGLGTSVDPILADTFYQSPNTLIEPDSFFDVFLAEIDPAYANENYEALLYAEVLNQPTVVGSFWNLNPQSPEPTTLVLLGLGSLAMMRRRR